ncbi:pyridoxal-phosphate dependent enzyme [Kocuria rhizophila]|nr:pyridoxal-phosphate dependent enzyme [Kocuria rhizophila]
MVVKFEGMNPTGSFKDRGMTMAITKAKEAGAQAVVCASTGNTSAVRGRLRQAGRDAQPLALVPEGKDLHGKMSQAVAHGADIIQVDGNFDNCLEAARSFPSPPGVPGELREPVPRSRARRHSRR